MLAYLAAIAPIVASVYACVSFIAELEQQRHVVRVFDRIDAWYRPQREALGELLTQPGELRRAERLISELNDRKAMILGYNGVDAKLGTRAYMNTMARPTAVSLSELRRQWALLVGSVAGVFLLALDAMSR